MQEFHANIFYIFSITPENNHLTPIFFHIQKQEYLLSQKINGFILEFESAGI